MSVFGILMQSNYLILIAFCIVNSDIQFSYADESFDGYKQFKNIIQEGIVSKFVNTILSTSAGGETSLNNVSQACYVDILRTWSDLRKTPTPSYALKLLDAEAKPPSGILKGNLFWSGNYDECLEVRSPISPETGRYFTGQYCLATVEEKQFINHSIVLGTCVPNSCNSSDVHVLTDFVLNYQHDLNITVQSIKCEEEKPLKIDATITISVCGLIVCLILVGTLVEFILNYYDQQASKQGAQVRQKLQINADHRNYEEPTERTGLLANLPTHQEEEDFASSTFVFVQRCRFLTSFSILNNTRKLFSISTSSGPMSSLNGLRVLSMWWVVLGHTYLFIDYLLRFKIQRRRFTFQAVLKAGYAVDTFFFLSGLLVTYHLLKQLKENRGRLNWFMFYFHRFWRLTPVYAFFLLFWTCLFIHFISGPVATYIVGTVFMKSLTNCRTMWWTNLLYINNFYPALGNVSDQCMGWSWYLANDMQFYILSPIIIILLFRKETIGIVVSVLLIFACVLIRALIADIYGIQVLSDYPSRHVDYFSTHSPIYDKPYTRMAPYLMGMLIGYVLYKTKCKIVLRNQKAPLITGLVVSVGWLIAAATGLAVVYGRYYNDHTEQEMSDDASVAYISLRRFAWSLAVAWVTLACVTGYGGPVNTLLSWKIWEPIGRLTYCTYLVHPMVAHCYILNQGTLQHYSDIDMIYLYIGNLVLSYLVAYVVSMAVEVPMMSLEKNIFKKKK